MARSNRIGAHWSKSLAARLPPCYHVRQMKELSESRILIVDDVRTNVDVLVQALRDEYKLSVALSGEQALRSIEKEPPDLVLLDIVLPGLDGYEVCRRLRATPATREIPVMFLSALEDVVNKTRGFEAGGNDYLVKPFEILEVKARVRSLLKAKAYSDAVKEKIASELEVARQIQLGILTQDVSIPAAGSGLEICSFLEPAREVGGDLYEVLRARDGSLVCVIGDVSGKGIPAALFMAITITLVRTLAPRFPKPEELLKQISDSLATQNPRNMFVTLFCAVYCPKESRLTYASAGHPPPLLIRRGNSSFLPCEPSVVAGVVPSLIIGSRSLTLEPNDLLLFYTDGVTEAFNERGELLGENRMLSEAADFTGKSPAEAIKRLLESVRNHAGDHPQSDDIAILALGKKP